MFLSLAISCAGSPGHPDLPLGQCVQTVGPLHRCDTSPGFFGDSNRRLWGSMTCVRMCATRGLCMETRRVMGLVLRGVHWN